MGVQGFRGRVCAFCRLCGLKVVGWSSCQEFNCVRLSGWAAGMFCVGGFKVRGVGAHGPVFGLDGFEASGVQPKVGFR